MKLKKYRIFRQNIHVIRHKFLKNHFNFSVTSEYTHSFNEKHNLHILAGFQAEDLKQTQFGLQRNGVLFPDKSEVDLTTDPEDVVVTITEVHGATAPEDGAEGEVTVE